ncbi:MAG: hypothetical protein HYY52_06305 [Candidatus Melainabacteria bacterium]|nr:hypothetical protein [Candidatus Melainabacteria bacterium]
MNFKELKEKFKDCLIIDSQSINLMQNPSYFRRQISEWKKKEWLIDLRKGMYIINDLYFKEKISSLYIANKMYTPSYISLEYALYEYEIIPETVKVITSITSRKTARFKNKFGQFSYTKIKNELFSGYNLISHQGQNILYAVREKAILDFIYINLSSFKETGEDFHHYRFQNLESISWKKLEGYMKKFESSKLKRVIKLLKRHYSKGKYRSL